MKINKENFLLASNLIKKSKNILLIPHAKMDCDGMSSAIALHNILTKIGKNPTAVCTDPVPEAFKFLPSTEIFTTEIDSFSQKSHSILISLDTSNKKFSGLEYEVQDGKVNIIISSEDDPFEETDFSFIKQSLKPDLIICLDSGDIKQLGKIYFDNTELFSSIPILNIDHHISNTQFGTINLVEMQNSSTTEIIYYLIPYLDEQGHSLITEDIATLLLAGLITDTGSFQHSNTTPKSLDIAAELIELGARQQEIIKHLFKTKTLATLRLWGRVLTQLQNDPIYRIVWSSISKEDLAETISHSDDAEGLIDELLSTTPGTEMVFLVKEREDGIISTSIRTSSSLINASEFAEKFGGGGHRQSSGFKIRERGGKSFEEIVGDIIFEAKMFQSKRLGIDPPVPRISNITNISQVEDQNKFENEIKDDKTDEEKEDIHKFPEFSIQEDKIEDTTENKDENDENKNEDKVEDKVEDKNNIKNPTPPIIENFVDMIESNTPIENSISTIEQKEDKQEDSITTTKDFGEDTIENIPPLQEEIKNTFTSQEESIFPVEKNIPVDTQEIQEKVSESKNTHSQELFDSTSPQNQSFSESTPITNIETRENINATLPDFLKPENINDTISRSSQDTNSNSSEEIDEFALFLEKAKEKAEDEKFDTAFQSQQEKTSPSIQNNEEDNDFLNFLQQENKETKQKKEEEKSINEEGQLQDSEYFGDDFLEALKKENPKLSPIESPDSQIFEIEKNS